MVTFGGKSEREMGKFTFGTYEQTAGVPAARGLKERGLEDDV